MKIVTVYQAFDGEVFDNEEGCRQWEFMTSHVPITITLYDKEFYPVDPEGHDEIKVALYSCYYIEIGAFADWKSDLEFLWWYWGICTDGIDGPGLYERDDAEGCWRKVNYADVLREHEQN